MLLDLTLVKSEVDKLTSQGKMFTAYDVTKALRKAGVWCRHIEVRDEVHALFENGNFDTDYRRTNGVVSDRNDYAWIYHHYMDDAIDYLSQNITVGVTPTTTKTTVPTPSTTNSNSLSEKKAVDSRGRLLVGKKYMDHIGADAGDVVGVGMAADGSKLMIFCGSAFRRMTDYVVDKDGAVRLGKIVLENLPTSNIREISVDDKLNIVIIK